MVRAFVIQTLNNETCKVVYSKMFSSWCQLSDQPVSEAEGHQLDEKTQCEQFESSTEFSFGGADLHTKSTVTGTITDKGDIDGINIFLSASQKKQFLQKLAYKIQSQYRLAQVISDNDEEGSVLCLQNYGQLPKEAFLKGCFTERLVTGSPQDLELVVMWQGAVGVGFFLILDKIENRLLAENILDLLIHYLQEQVNFLCDPGVALTYIDRINVVVNQFLPGGELLFINSYLLKQFEKQLGISLSGK